MAVTQTAIIEGVVARTSSRNVTSKTTGEQYTFNNALVIGENTLAEVRIPQGIAVPKDGAQIRARVTLGSYNGQAEVSLDAYL